MYICVCNAISDRSVRNCSARTVSELFRHHGTRPQCGQCVSHLRRMLAEATGLTSPALSEAGD